MNNYSNGLSLVEGQKIEIPISMVSNQLDKTTLEELTCPICSCLIWDIVDCSNCGNIFCKNCINASIEKISNSCPICRESPFKSSGSKALKKLFLSIHLICPNELCKEKTPYYDYINHLINCKYRKYHCENIGCNYENIVANRKDIEEHSKICKYRFIGCVHCKKIIREIDYEKHLNKECSQIVECSFCHKKMKRWFFNSNHNNNSITNDITCLKNKVEYYKNKSEEYEEKFKITGLLIKSFINAYKKIKTENIELKEKCKIEEFNTLKKLNEISKDNSFKKYPMQSFLNKKRTRK